MSQDPPHDSLEPPESESPHNESPELAASWDSIDAFERLKAGDSRVAERIYTRYARRLILLARRRMTERLAARVDPDDIVMSAYRSFFVRADGGQFAIEETGGLWRLLVEITMHKLYRQARHHRAQRRTYEKETHAAAEPSASVASPEAAAIAAEEIEWLMQQLPEAARKSLELRLRGFTLQEIASQSDKNEKTVRRHLAKARSALSSRMQFTDLRAVAREKVKRNCRPSTSRVPAGLDFDDYKLLEQIGQGSTGKVYRARCRSSNAIVAVKYLRKRLQQDQRFIKRMEREAETVQAIDHSGICRIEGWGVTPGNGRFLVMDYLEGGDLQAQLANGPMPESIVIGLVSQVAVALQAAHEKGIVHCDIKPGNILLRKRVEVITAQSPVAITDFGFARDISEGFPVSFAGTPAFMAPEQIDVFWGPISPATDVYGLGALLYALLTSKPPVDGNDSADIMARIGSGAATIEWQRLSEAADGLVELCRDCLESRPADRPASPLEIVERFQVQRPGKAEKNTGTDGQSQRSA